MFGWLLQRSPINEAIEAEDYPRALQLVRDQIDRDRRPQKQRPLRQTLAEVLVLCGQREAGILVLRELMNEYSREEQQAKAIAIHKRIAELDAEAEETELDRIAEAIVEQRLIELSPVEKGKEVGTIPEVVTSRVARTPLFSSLSKIEVRALIQGLRLEKKEPGDVVMVEGEPGSSLFILTEGSVGVHVRNAAGRTTPIRDMEGPAFFGEISIVYGKPRTATITCRTHCELLELERAALDGITGKHPAVAKVLKEFCDQRAESAEERGGRESR